MVNPLITYKILKFLKFSFSATLDEIGENSETKCFDEAMKSVFKRQLTPSVPFLFFIYLWQKGKNKKSLSLGAIA